MWKNKIKRLSTFKTAHEIRNRLSVNSSGFFQQGQCTSRKLIILYWTWLFCFRIWRGRNINKTESGQARVVVVLFGRPLPRQAVTSHGTMEEMWELMRVILHRVKQRRIRKNHYWGKQTYFFAVRKISWQERALSIRKDIISCQYIHPTARECGHIWIPDKHCRTPQQIFQRYRYWRLSWEIRQ